ncbi:THO complex subunit 1 isoform X2 [Procambarus clarkii]|uniref:THO complex subunit 1 isoform X2 n=1 Tax=Procambarus clarkii TaxID=6728 RepID=UPI001E678DCF|nr:THO complex subunit 1-like isoform X2 [Procambarus clarkii]
MADGGLNFQRIFTKVQSTLPRCIEDADALSITNIFSTKITETTKHCVEAAIRNYVTKKVIDGEATDLATITAITSVCIDLVRHELSLPTLPVLVLTDSFDMLTIKQCELLFSFVESNVGVWKEDTFFAPCKTSVLRMCNDLLRRLSRSQNTVFCGRILLFLARFFPFSERSGLNLVSEFNLENVTTFTNVETTDMEDDDDEEKGEETRLRLDYTLYTKFWSLQDFFRNPVQCFQKAPWKMFTMYCGDVLEAFKSFKLDNVQSSGSGGAHLTRTLSEPTHSEDSSSLQFQVDQYFAKYLTNQKLLDLQFSDANFRRYVLLQILILAQYLTSNIKFKQETLTEDQLAWVKKTEELVYTLLEETPPDGPVFVNTVKHILKREVVWSEWKNEGCPEFKKPEGYEKLKAKLNGKGEEEKEDEDSRSTKKLRQKRKVGDMIRDADSKNKFSMGNVEMSRLWNLNPNNLAACKMLERDFVPALETYFTPAIEQLSPKSELKEKDRLVNDSNFGWRGLRLLACRSPHFFTHSASPIATLPEYLTTMIKKLAKELPSQLTADIKVEDDDDKEEEKVIPVLEQNDGVKEDEEDMEEDGEEERPEVKAITEEEQKALAKNLDKLGQDKWKLLAKKLGFVDDEIEFIEKDKAAKAGSVESQAAFMLKLWVENEGDEANKDSLLYTLGGMKLTAIADDVFT